MLLFITNGLKKELLGKLESAGYSPKYDQKVIISLLSSLEKSIEEKNTSKSIEILKGAFDFTRKQLRINLNKLIDSRN